MPRNFIRGMCFIADFRSPELAEQDPVNALQIFGVEVRLRPVVIGREEPACRIGRLLGQSEEYKALRRASERLREDAEVQRQLADVEHLAQAIEQTSQQGKEPGREQVEQYDRALQSVQGSPVYQQVVAAQTNFEKLMAKVNERIFDGMKKGAASPIITLG